MKIYLGRFVLMSAAAASSLCLFVSSADSQGVGAKVTVQSVSPEAEIKLLRQLQSELEARVQKLENKVELAKSFGDEEAQAKKIEQRLSAIEREQQKLQAEGEKNKDQPGEEHAASHAKAPFVVYDDDGHSIFRVELHSVTNQPRIVVGNPLGTHAVIGANGADKTSAVILYGTAADTAAVILAGGDQSSYLQLKPLATADQVTLGKSKNGDFGLFISRNGLKTVELETADRTGAGYFGLADASGQNMVQAGTDTDRGVGLVRVGPDCCQPPPAMGPHEYIRGKKKN